MKMKHVYADAEEKYVMNTILYGHSDTYLYADEAHTQKVDAATLLNVCQKGILVHYKGAYYIPVFFKENSGHLEVTIATAISSGASTSVVLYSSEYNAEE